VIAADFAVVGASLCLGTGSIFQDHSAKREKMSGGIDPRLLVRLLGSPAFLLGLALGGSGFLLTLVALRSLPLFVAQLAVAASVGVTAALSVALGREVMERRKLAALVAIVGGLALAAEGAANGPVGPIGLPAQGLIIGGAIALALAIAMERRRPSSIARLGVLAGLGYGGCALAARAGHFGLDPFTLVTRPLAWATGLYALLGLLSFATLLQRTTVTTAQASITVAQVVAPAVLGLVLLGDHVRPGQAPAVFAGFTAALIGACAIVRQRSATPRLAGTDG
jgi:drug/metabolite transporter (DMT)-like permease